MEHFGGQKLEHVGRHTVVQTYNAAQNSICLLIVTGGGLKILTVTDENVKIWFNIAVLYFYLISPYITQFLLRDTYA